MRKLVIILLLCIIGMACSAPVVKQSDQQSVPKIYVRHMNITGEIGKLDYGYVIRSKTPSSTIFTILNPVPAVLDPYAASEKIVSIDIRVVSGDNVEIEKIEGKAYPQNSDNKDM